MPNPFPRHPSFPPPRALLAAIAALPLSLWTPSAQAVGLGEVLTQSAIGQPLHIEIQLPGEGPDRVAPECIRVIPQKTRAEDGIPSINSAHVAIRRSGNSAVAVITDPAPANHPILRLRLQEACNSNLKREYMLLLSDPPEITPAARAPQAPRPPQAIASAKEVRRSVAPRGYKLWTARGGESLNALAERRHPGDEAAQAQFIALTQKANAGQHGRNGLRPGTRLKAGTQIYLPPNNRAGTPPRPAATPSSAERPATQPPATKQGDQLVLQGQAAGQQPPLKIARELGGNDTATLLSEDERDVMRREQKLQATVNDQIAMQADVAQRLRKLEALQAELRAQITSETPAASAAPAPAPPPTPGPVVESPRPPRPPKSEGSFWPMFVALLGGMGIAAFLWSRRRRPAARPSPARVTAPAREVAPPPKDIAAKANAAPLAPPPPSPPPPPATPESVALVWDAFPPSSIEPHVLPSLSDEEFLAEHDSAIELAEIMLSFGRVHGAAETLAEFIRAHPHKSLAPWVKLLEVYHTAEMQAEFEALSQRMNQTFNVSSIAWETFDAALRGAPARVEDLPHLMEPINRLWGSAEGLAYMDGLLRDNREGTRQGFAIGVADDILMLISVLDYQLRLREAQAHRKTASA